MRSRKDDNAFLAAADPEAVQAAADRLSASIIRKRLDYWTLLVGPKFSKKDRDAINLSRHYSVQQVEYCRNLIFRRNSPIHKLFERSCDMGLQRLVPDKITEIFGFRVHKRLSASCRRFSRRSIMVITFSELARRMRRLRPPSGWWADSHNGMPWLAVGKRRLFFEYSTSLAS